MKLSVVSAFVDKNTGEPYNAGATFESTDKDRIKELQDGGFLGTAPVKEERKKKESPSDDTNKDKGDTNTGEQTDVDNGDKDTTEQSS